MIPYAELQATSNFSFLRGASHPGELVEAAAGEGLAAIALTDRNSLAGVVRAHQAARETGIRFVLGVRLDLRERVAEPVSPEAGEAPAAERSAAGPARPPARGLLRAPAAFVAPTPAIAAREEPAAPWPKARRAQGRDPDENIFLSVLAYPT